MSDVAGLIELKPCPFCGDNRAMVFEPTCRPETPYNPADRLFPIVRCMSCYAEAAGKSEDYRGVTAIAAWNNRPPEASLSARIAELERERDEARRNEWPFGPRPNPVMGHTFGDFAVWGDEKSIKRVQAAMHEHDAMMPARIERIRQEAARAEAAEAKLAKAEEALRDIAAMADPGDPKSYRCDDREGCLDTVLAVARAVLSPMPNKEG